MKGVVQTLEETVTQVHITDWVDAFGEVNASWHLTVAMGPLMLNSLHMPLIYNNDDFLLRALINCLEKILVTLVNENLLESWEENIHTLDVPIQKMRVNTSL